MIKKKLTRLAAAIALALPAYSAHAFESHTVYSPEGTAVFELRFFNVGDGPYQGSDKEPRLSTWNLNQEQKNKIINATTQWATILKAKPEQLPGIINVGTYEDFNAGAIGGLFYDEERDIYLSALQGTLQGQNTDESLAFNSHAQVLIGRLDFDEVDFTPSQIPMAEKIDFQMVMFHELGHTLGISNHVMNKEDGKHPQFIDILSSFGTHLYDDNGNPAQQLQEILCTKCDTPYDPAAFDVRKDQGYFSGTHVSEVLAGGLPGVPVKLLGSNGNIDHNYMSHLELKNSMMSHQDYRNYSTFMEAELALMQDMGYQIDRRNFFGHSVYGSGLNLINTNGFFKRNADGTAYVAGEYNTSKLGLGLHVYGSNNTITQQADLLAKGDGSAGVRVDGEANTLIIAPTTRVYADGLNGRGVLFAYGKDHNLVQQGDVQALGQNGIAVSFDFGYNLFGYDDEYHGSYIHNYKNKPAKPLDELNGALVNQFDLSGRVAGTKAAIHLSKNALVNQINIMQGAQIKGDIISDYAQRDENDQLRLTTLNFGKDANGHADAAFQINYDDNILGQNIALVAQGGQTALNGQNQVFNVRVAPTATLTGNASYTLNEAQAFINEGTVAPGNNDFGRITINGNYQQLASGTLLVDVDAARQHDTLAVSGNAALDGQLRLDAQPGWYAQDWKLLSNEIVQSTSISGDFATISATIPSPTLSLQTTPVSAGVSQLSIARQAQAYNQYAQDDNQYAVGTALYEVAALAQTDIQPLYTFLDFSAIDGSTVQTALTQLSPIAYSAMVASSLSRERQLANVINTRTAPASGTDWQGFAAPFGERSSQDSRGSMVASKNSSYGLVLGVEKNGLGQNTDLSLAVYGAVSRQSVSLKENLSGKGHSTALHLGIQLRFTPNPKAGIYAFGRAQLGWEDSKFDRQIRLPGYATSGYKSDWTAWSGTVEAGGGYRWALSESLSAGPIAQLSYTTLGRPSVTESGDATALSIDSQRFHALRSSLGVSAHFEHLTAANKSLKAQFQATWDRELLNKDFVQDASFAGYQAVSFKTRNQVTGKNALGLRAGLSYEVNNRLAIAAGLSTSLFQSGYKSVAGNVSAQWRF